MRRRRRDTSVFFCNVKALDRRQMEDYATKLVYGAKASRCRRQQRACSSEDSDETRRTETDEAAGPEESDGDGDDDDINSTEKKHYQSMLQARRRGRAVRR
jgi:hypothetical protein